MEHTDEDLGRLVWGEAEQRAARGDTSYVRELGEELADRHAAAAERVREYDRHLAHVVRVLALSPGRDGLAQLLRLLDAKTPSGSGGNLRAIASLLAEHHRVADLADAVFDRVERDRLDELRACLFHELVLRGVDIDDFPGLRSWPLVRPGWHPLAWLPPYRSDLEAEADFPSRSMRGATWEIPTGLPTEGRVDPPAPRTTEKSALRDIATVDVHETVVSAVNAGDWGNCAAWVFRLDEPIAPDEVPALLPTLPMPCVEGLGPEGRFEIAVRPADDIWRLLFATASMGGMYGSGVQGAYGRLWAWRSLAGLSGAPAGASAEAVERHALQSAWFHFEADTDWFHNEVGNDYGIAALSPDRRRIAVLAATDTD
ncbi:DUF6183 family protein [Streptomyces narbonensis]|uniref:DUF6183 family protein n=1 Tax=Streptomyces narbonensis TaxID=67333 RepID=UPI001678D296|nr:DUF6183 family protein [Streptomyces narbonensis]GGW03046.1 hypothetical protein GCM10010230_37120 [Streptomyces narbonensis]